MNINSEQLPFQTPENLYTKMTGLELVKGYLDDTIPGQEVMGRLLQEIDLSEAAQRTVVIDEKEINIEDYLSVARSHGRALPYILKFVAMPEKDKIMRDGMKQTILGYLGE